MAFTLQYTNLHGERQSKEFIAMGIDPDAKVFMRDDVGTKFPLNELVRPVVLDGTDDLENQIFNLDESMTTKFVETLNNEHDLPLDVLKEQLFKTFDNQVLPLKVSLKMHEIMSDTISSPERMNVGAHIPAVFKVELNGRTRVGWNFARNEDARLGHRSHYDRGLSSSHQKNQDRELIATPPLTVEQTKSLFEKNDVRIPMVFLLDGGAVLGGVASFNQDLKQFYLGNVMIPEENVVCATQLPEQNSQAWKLKVESGDPRNGQYVFAWDSDKVQASHSGRYVDYDKFDATGKSNMRFQGTTGAFFGGLPWATKKSWASTSDIAEHAMLQEFSALRQHLTQTIARRVEIKQDKQPTSHSTPSSPKPGR